MSGSEPMASTKRAAASCLSLSVDTQLTLAKEEGALILEAGLHGDIPVKVALIGEGLEAPDAADQHAQLALAEQVPVTAARHVLGVGHHAVLAAHAGEHGLQHGHVFGRIDGEGGVVLLEQAPAVALDGLVELVVGDGLIIAPDVVTQRADLFSSRLRLGQVQVSSG